jgi:hypothetical protein
MNGIFISYRRNDAPGYAGRLYDRLAAKFGADRVFMDVEGIEPGVDFVDAVERALASCEILIVLIGKDWLAVDSAGRRRLDDPADFVHLETITALSRGIRVVPVLVEGAEMPRADSLPADLLPLTRRQAVELSHNHWEANSAELVRHLQKILDQDKGKTSAAALTRGADEAQPAEPALTPELPSSPGVAHSRMHWWVGSAALLIAAGVLLYVTQPWHRETKPAPAPAVIPAPALAFVAPDKLDFAEQRLRAAGPPSEITLSNRGGQTLRISGVKLEGPGAADFALSENQCNRGELAPGASCTLKVSFSPQAVGARAATLVIAHGATDATATVSLVGRGAEPVVAAAAPPIDKTKPLAAVPVAPPEHKPDIAAASPKILRFESRHAEDKVQLCYGVENAAGAMITPEPGAVKPLENQCVLVAAGPRKTYTLSARSAAGAVVTRTIDVEGVAATAAAAAPAPAAAAAPATTTAAATPAASAAATIPGFPRVGDSWQYNFRSMWKNVEPRTFVHQVTRVSDRDVTETMSFVANGNKISDSKSFGADSRFVEWRGQGYYFVEFNPFLQAFGTLQPGTTWKSLVTPIEDPFLTNWYSQGRVIGWDSVSVPAGTFKALRVELNSNRNPSASSAAQGTPARIQYVLWYAPDAKRTVKHVRTVLTQDGTKLAEDTYELVKYAVQ